MAVGRHSNHMLELSNKCTKFVTVRRQLVVEGGDDVKYIVDKQDILQMSHVTGDVLWPW